MKRIFLTLVLVFFATDAYAMPENAGISVVLPVKSRIVNLAAMPVDEALAFCDDRDMACPAIRAKQPTASRNSPENTNTAMRKNKSKGRALAVAANSR